MSGEKEEVYRKLRATREEFGQKLLDKAVIISPYDFKTLGHSFIHAPTISEITLGNVPFLMARFFEDI